MISEPTELFHVIRVVLQLYSYCGNQNVFLTV